MTLSHSPRMLRRVVRPALPRPVACVIGCVLLFGACSDLVSLDEPSPTRLGADQLYTPENAQLLLAGAVGDFECALASYIVSAGLVADELGDSGNNPSSWDLDRRAVNPANASYGAGCGGTGLYTPVSIARYTSDRLLTALDSWTDAEVPNRQALVAQAAAFAGYSLVLLGEAMCTAAIDGGLELTRAQLQALAEERFTRAISAASGAGNAAILNLARAGRARARLDQGKAAEALTDAAAVPDGFVHNATYSQINARRENVVNTATYRSNSVTVEVPFRALGDPRVQVTDAGVLGADRLTPIWRPAKYPTPSSPIPIATWREARLIQAEASLTTGAIQPAVDAINALRTSAGLPPYGGGTLAEVTAQVREERRRELFLEGHRLGDMIRFQVVPVPAAGTPYSHGGTYGSQLCLPLPDIERNNNPSVTR